MSWFFKSLNSSIGQKLAMAVSGFLLVGFLVAHLSGNLLIFAGPEAMNAYAKSLRDLGPLLWVARAGLLLFVAVHIFTAFSLYSKNKAARPSAYKHKQFKRASYASRTMVMSGPIVLAFVLYHLAHFTLRVTDDRISEFGALDVYDMVIYGFQSFPVVFFYSLSLMLLCLHLNHGISSMFRSLGWNHPKYNNLLSTASKGLSLLLLVGFLSIPFSVMTGLVR